MAAVAAVIVCSALAYSNTLNSPFVFDDIPYVSNNPLIRDPQNLIHPKYAGQYRDFFEYPTFVMRTVGVLSFALNYALHGLSLPGYHVVNLLIHLSNVILVYMLSMNLFRATDVSVRSGVAGSSQFGAAFAASAAAASLFAVHPVQTEAVTYISQRFTSLAALFYLLSLVLYSKWRCTAERRRAWPLYAASLLSATLAMKTKETAFTIPFVIAVYELLFHEKDKAGWIRRLAPFCLLLSIIPLSLLLISNAEGGLLAIIDDMTRAKTDMSRLLYMLTEVRVVVTYLRLLVLPSNQNLDYDYVIAGPDVPLQFLWAAVVICSLIGSGFVLRIKSRRFNMPELNIISFGIFWFFITLLIESSLIPTGDVIFEHRLYLPSAGIFIAVCTAGVLALRRLSGRRPYLRPVAVVILVVIVGIFSVATYRRNKVWADEITLWTDVVSKSPMKARGHLNLGNKYFRLGQYDKALLELRKITDAYPKASAANNSIGMVLVRRGDLRGALRHYNVALQSRPDYAEALKNRAAVEAALGMSEEARRDVSAALAIYPDYEDAIRLRNDIERGIVSKPELY